MNDILILLATVVLSPPVFVHTAQGPAASILTHADPDDPTRAVLAAAAAIMAAFGRHDSDAYFSLFDPQATFIFYTTPRRLESRAEYQQEWAAWEKELGFRVRSCRSSDPRVQVFGDVAVFTHAVRTEVTTNQGETTLDERETIVFQRRDGRWIAVHEHLSPAAKN
jgi:ketosteroid isomerase-like protein